MAVAPLRSPPWQRMDLPSCSSLLQPSMLGRSPLLLLLLLLLLPPPNYSADSRLLTFLLQPLPLLKLLRVIGHGGGGGGGGSDREEGKKGKGGVTGALTLSLDS